MTVAPSLERGIREANRTARVVALRIENLNVSANDVRALSGFLPWSPGDIATPPLPPHLRRGRLTMAAVYL